MNAISLDQINIQLNELEITANDICAGELSGAEAAEEIRQRTKFIREHLPEKRGGWKNAASKANGKKGGRPPQNKECRS